MDIQGLIAICDQAIDEDKMVWLVHRGVGRDVYPFGIRNGMLYVWCSIHPDRDVESMYISNINQAEVSKNEVGLIFQYESEFGTKENM